MQGGYNPSTTPTPLATTGIAGQGGSSGVTVPGGLVRVNSAGNGRGAPYDPYSLTFADSVSRVSGNHLLKVGADARLVLEEQIRNSILQVVHR